MLTVKAFEKGLVCKGFTYEIGKEYSIPTEEVGMCEKGFRASANCDLSETIDCYSDFDNTEYALVDLNVVETMGNKAVGDRIKIIKKLESFKELIEYDKTGKWCVFYAQYLCSVGSKDDLIKELEDAVVEKDTTGKWCYYFADFIQGADINKLQDAVIEKDTAGEWCYQFAECIDGADISKLQDVIVKKDTTGRWCYYFAKNIQNADVEKLQNAVIEKDATGKWCCYFAESVKGADIDKLQDTVIKKDTTGKWCYHFARSIHGANIEKLEDALIKKDTTGEWCCLFARYVKGADIHKLQVKRVQKVSEQKEKTVIQKLRNLEEENKQLKKIMRDILDSEAYVEYVDECRRWGYECSFCGAFVRDNQPLSEMKHKQDCVIAEMIKILEGR